MSAFKKYLLGGDATHTAGDGLGLYGPYASRKLSDDSAKRNGSIISRESGASPSSEAAFQKSLQICRDPPPSAASPTPTLSREFPNGTRAPRSSKATEMFPSPHIQMSPPLAGASDSAEASVHELSAANAKPEKKEKEATWRDLEIPEELGLVDDDLPIEIRNIVHDTLEMHRAMQLSRMQSTDEDDLEAEQQKEPETAAAVKDSAERSTSAFRASDERRRDGSHDPWEGSSSQAASTHTTDEKVPLQTVKSGVKPTSGAQNPLTKTKSAQSDTLSPLTNITSMEARFYQSRDRSSRSKGLYNLFKRHRAKALPSPKTSVAEHPPVECTSCFDDIPHREAVDGLPCHHRYCLPCFTQLVSTAILSENTYPPKCCLTQIPKPVMRRYLPPSDLVKFEEKTLEYAVPLANRYYCVAPDCARWIDTRDAKRVNGGLECPHCLTILCTICRGPQHPATQDCPQDFGLDATLEQAERAGWRRCHNCRAMVELNTGCRHITCKCRAEFCYTCGAVWQTCHCTEADQRHREEQLERARDQRQAEQEAEEAEMRRAIAAVEDAERQLREEREAEEAREQARMAQEAEELAQKEFERVERIGERYAELRAILDHVGLQQKQAIEKRQYRQASENDDLLAGFDARVAARTVEIESEKTTALAESEKSIKSLQKGHAAALMETIQRHRRDQDALMAKEIPSENPNDDAEMAKAAMLEALMPLQELERTTLKAQQARETEKWRARGQRAAAAINTIFKIQQMKFDEEEGVARAVDAANKQEDADAKWFDLVHGDRANMLAEDERRLVLSGAELDASGIYGHGHDEELEEEKEKTATSKDLI